MMMTFKLDGNKCKKCAFCKYWYDPTNQYIQPHLPNSGLWKFDNNAKAKCLKKNVNMASTAMCSYFENKI